MRIAEIIARSDRPAFSFEFFPPKTEDGLRNLFEAVVQLRPLAPDFVSVSYGAGGSTRHKTIEIVHRIKEEHGLEAMAHFTCVGSTVAQLRETLDDMVAAGVDNVLALRGDPPAGQEQVADKERIRRRSQRQQREQQHRWQVLPAGFRVSRERRA